MSLEIFKRYVCYKKKINNRLLSSFSKLFTRKVNSLNREFKELLDRKDFEKSFTIFLKNNLSNDELCDYYILFHLLEHSKERDLILQAFHNLGFNQYYKTVEEFIDVKRTIGKQDFIQYILDNPQFKKSWSNLSEKNEPGLLIRLTVMDENVDCLMQLQGNNLKENDLELIKQESYKYKRYWVYYYLNQKHKGPISHTVLYSSLDYYLQRNIELQSNMAMLMNYVEFNGIIKFKNNIKLLKEFIRNIELSKFALNNCHIYLNTEKEFDKNYPKYSVFMNEKWKIIEELIYLDNKTINNETVVKKIIKF